MKLIPLTQGKEAMVDDEDYDFLMQWKWSLAHGYAVRAMPGTAGLKIYMHRVVNQTPDDKMTDHKDSDGLNNQKSNLRSCDRSENNRNRRVNKSNSSGLKGVTWYKRSGKWLAQFASHGQRFYLGYFPTAELAHEAYCKYAVTYHGEFHRTN